MSKQPKILLIEDDETLAFVTSDNLSRAGFAVSVATDGDEGYALFCEKEFDICLVDVMLPKTDGFTLAKKIRATNQHVPILFLTARSMIEDKITGLSLGGDDYITKPFSMEELILKIRVFLKRSSIKSGNSTSNLFKIGQFTFDFDELTLKHPDINRELTLKEAELLRFFCNNTNSVLNRSVILESVWGDDDYFLGRSLDVFISRLRKYLKPDPNVKIANLHGIGFKFTYKKS